MKIGKIDGRTGTYALGEEGKPADTQIAYEILGWEHVRMTVDGVTWELDYWHDSRSVTIASLKRDGEEMPHEQWNEDHWSAVVRDHGKGGPSTYAKPEWVPAWMEWVEEGPAGVCDIQYMIKSHAIRGLCEEKGIPFDDDIENYGEDEDGNVEIWDESEE